MNKTMTTNKTIQLTKLVDGFAARPALVGDDVTRRTMPAHSGNPSAFACRRLPIQITLAGLLAIAVQPNVRAQTWQTVLDYQLAAGQHSEGHGIVADAAGNVFSGGNGDDASGVGHGIVLKTDTTQVTWYFSDDTNPSTSQYESMVWDLGHDSNGNLYSVGQLWPNNTPGVAHWYVRKSSDGGLSWSTLFEPDGSLYQYTPGQWVYPTGFAADNSGNIYVVGGGRDATVVGSGKNAKVQSTIHWLVRKSADGGQTWRLVDDLVTGQPIADAAAVVPGVGVFVVGAHFNSQWIVRRSPTGEPGSWSTVAGPINNAAAHGVCGDSQGKVYVVGSQFVTTGVGQNKGPGRHQRLLRLGHLQERRWRQHVADRRYLHLQPEHRFRRPRHRVRSRRQCGSGGKSF